MILQPQKIWNLQADINSLDTNSQQRDTHLKSDDFFNAEQYNQLKFTGKKYEQTSDGAKLHGELTISEITKPITVYIDFAGIVVGPYRQIKAGFTVDGKLSRKNLI